MQDAAVAQRLAESSLLGALDPASREALVALGRQRRFGVGQTLFQRGDPPDFMALILSGCVRVCLFSAERKYDIHSWHSMKGGSCESGDILRHVECCADRLGAEMRWVLAL